MTIVENLHSTNIKWLALVFITLYTTGCYYCFDNPAAIQSQLQEQLSISVTQYASLYSVYSLPNLFLPVLGGILVDKLGLRIGSLLFMTFTALGQLIFALGGYHLSYKTMIIGRFIYGVGNESLYFS